MSSFWKSISLKNIALKIIRQEGSPESVARGVCIGLTVGLILPIGLQTLPALLLAFLFRANKVLAWTFTCITNPATVFFIYPIQCYLGSLILFHPLTVSSFEEKFGSMLSANSIADAFMAFLSLGSSIMIPFFAGGILLAVLLATPGYFLSYKLVLQYRERRARRRLKQMAGKQKKL